MYGHTARVFRSKIIESGEKVFVVSVGEDSNVCIWSRDGQLIHRQLVPGNVTIWNVEWDPIRQRLLTSDSVGNVTQFPVRDIIQGNHFKSDVLPNMLSDGTEHLAKIRVMQKEHFLIALTNKNRLLYLNVLDPVKWLPLSAEVGQISYKSLILEVQEGSVAICGFQQVSIFHFLDGSFKLSFHERISDGIVRSVKFLDSNSFIASCEDGKCSLFELKSTEDWSHRLIGSFDLPSCKERWITSACRYENCLLVGDRCGNVHWFSIAGDKIDFKRAIKLVHGNLGSTCLNFIEQRGEILALQSAGHDGHLKTIEIDVETEEMCISFTERVPINWCDKIFALKNGRGTMVSGFNDNHFVTWSPETETLHEYECGGGHRYWDLHVEKESYEKVSLAAYFIRKKQLQRVRYSLNLERPPFAIQRHKWHNKPCNDIRTIHAAIGGLQKTFLVSGGDDNTLKIHEVSSNGKANFVSDMILHISNIKCVKTVELSDRVLIFSCGGRAQICVTEMTFGDGRIREKCDYMLRPNDSERKRMGKSQAIDFDPETRLMSVSVLRRGDHCYELYVGCSDGFVRCFSYDSQRNAIHLGAAVFYNRCILHVDTIQLAGHDLLITSATDGIVCFWPLNAFHADAKPTFSLVHHASGINSFDCCHYAEDGNEFWIATGGDDQSFMISKLKIDDSDGKLQLAEQKHFPLEHTAQVNGVQFCREYKVLYTVGVDQVLYRVFLEQFDAQRYAITCISDTKGLRLIHGELLLCYGCGIQFSLVNVRHPFENKQLSS